MRVPRTLKMRRGVYSLRAITRYIALTPPFSSVWQIARGMVSAFKTPHTSLPRPPFGGVRTTPLGLLLTDQGEGKRRCWGMASALKQLLVPEGQDILSNRALARSRLFGLELGTRGASCAGFCGAGYSAAVCLPLAAPPSQRIGQGRQIEVVNRAGSAYIVNQSSPPMHPYSGPTFGANL